MKNFLISIPDSIIARQAFAEIQQINEVTLEYGLRLSDNDIKIILSTRSEALSSSGRVEFGGEIITRLIMRFCDSPYISQYNYVETIDELIETFYHYKNETMDGISDDELIDFMKECFDNKCQGDLELLRYKYLDTLAHNVKYGVVDYLEVDEALEEEMEGDEE
ncbi:MAG: DUF6323 family protein [Bacillota bacterium]|nr:DUF6323 family protein [Bacillota bacterium]